MARAASFTSLGLMGKETINQEQVNASFQVGVRAGEEHSQKVTLKARLKDRSSHPRVPGMAVGEQHLRQRDKQVQRQQEDTDLRT